MNIEIHSFDVIDSTNTEALKRAKDGAAEGICILAREQTAGRGRFGRSFVSPKDGGLYFSMILRPALALNELPLITLMAGIAVHQTLTEIGIGPDIKWVNDIYVNEKKICGILCENTSTDLGTAIVVGIGVNLRSANFPAEIADIATSIETETGKVMTGAELAAPLTKYLIYYYDLLKADEGGQNIINEWKVRSTYYAGKKVKAATDGQIVFGVTEGLEPNGALRLRLDNGTLTIIQAGDIEQLRAS